MGVLTARPNATNSIGSGWAIGGGAATYHAALSDTADATYADTPGYAPDSWRGLRVGLGDIALPANSKVKAVRFRMRSKDDSTWPYDTRLEARPFLAGYVNPGVVSVKGKTTITDYTGGWETYRPTGGAWTQADLNNLEALLLSVPSYSSLGSGGRIYEIYFDAEYNEAPVVSSLTVNAPAEVSRPTINWAITDAEGDPQQSYESVVFSGTGTVADPSVGAAVWRSGRVLDSQGRSVVVGVDLAAGSYRSYHRVFQPAVSGQEHGSTWATTTFTVVITPPAAPGLTATADNTNARISLAYVKNNPDSGTLLTVEYSDDAGVTWAPHPGLADLPITGNGTVYDYESRPTKTRQYRAKIAFGTKASAYSATTSATVTTRRNLLKDVLYPALNLTALIATGDVKVVEFDLVVEEPQYGTDPVGRQEAVVVTEGVRGRSGSLKLRTKTTAAREALEAISQTGRPLLLQDVFGRNWYVKLGAQHPWRLVKAMDPTGVYPIRDLWEVTFPFKVVARPVA